MAWTAPMEATSSADIASWGRSWTLSARRVQCRFSRLAKWTTKRRSRSRTLSLFVALAVPVPQEQRRRTKVKAPLHAESGRLSMRAVRTDSLCFARSYSSLPAIAFARWTVAFRETLHVPQSTKVDGSATPRPANLTGRWQTLRSPGLTSLPKSLENYCKVTHFRPVPMFILLTWKWFMRTNFRTFQGQNKMTLKFKDLKTKRNFHRVFQKYESTKISTGRKFVTLQYTPVGPTPLKHFLVIFGRSSLFFFMFESSWKSTKYDTTFPRMRSGHL